MLSFSSPETKLLGFLLQILVLRHLKPDMEEYYVGTVLYIALILEHIISRWIGNLNQLPYQLCFKKRSNSMLVDSLSCNS